MRRCSLQADLFRSVVYPRERTDGGGVLEGRFLPSFLSLSQFQMLWVIAAFSGLELLCWERHKEMQ